MSRIIIREENNKIILRESSIKKLNYLNGDEKLYLNGNSSNTYFMFNTSTNRLELWVNGVKQNEWG